MACACSIAVPPEQQGARDLEEDRLRAASVVLGPTGLRTTFLIPDMHCIACVRRIENSLAQLDFVIKARANLSQRTVQVDWRGEAGQACKLSETLESEGFEATALHAGDAATAQGDKSYRRLLSCVAVAGFAAANVMLLSVSVWSGATAETRDLFHLISGLIAIPAATYAGRPFFVSAWAALRNWRLNMDVPISLAVVLALAMSIVESLRGGEEAYFDAALMLLFFLLIGRTLDALMRDRARNAVDVLAKMAAKGAVRLTPDGAREYVSAETLQPGDYIYLTAGDRIPTDGIVRSESGELDRSLVTGESQSVVVRSGDSVEAGTLNMAGPLELEVTKTAEQSFLGEVAAMMAAAETGRSRFIKLADRVAGYYAPVVHLLALSAFVGWMVVSAGDWQHSLYTAIAVLIITCPCALALAVPIVHVIAAGELFSNGVLTKDGTALERLTDIDAVVLDKTGTLTHGRPRVVRTSVDDDELKIAGSLAQASRHPVAQAIANFAQTKGPTTIPPEGIREWPGAGVEGTWNGAIVRLGRPDWVNEIALANTQGPAETVATDVAFARAGKRAATFELADTLRAEAHSVVKSFKDAGFPVHILSGDNHRAVQAVAMELGIESYEAEQKPEDKIVRLGELAASGHRVLMIGDGLNDGPALAVSHVSMAPSSGSDVGRQAADFVFTTDHLGPVIHAWYVARKANALARQNIGLAVCYNCIAVPLAMAGFVTPLVAAVAMSASSIVVVANSLRLYGYKGANQRQQQQEVDVNRASTDGPLTGELQARATT